jgi:hypothetical protein
MTKSGDAERSEGPITALSLAFSTGKQARDPGHCRGAADLGASYERVDQLLPVLG